MIVELHLLQNFAPSNLNRDDTGSPKDAEFGGYRRARISSQCQKRAIRTAFEDYLTPLGLEDADLAERTKLVVNECVTQLQAADKDEATARAVVTMLLSGLSLKTEDSLTQYLLFLGRREIRAFVTIALAHWDELADLVATDEAKAKPAAQASRRGAKKDAAAVVPKQIVKELQAQLNGGKAIDLALFGRMVADLPDINRDAACQVAHTLSTHRVNTEFDYFTAVDDLQPEDQTGAGMIGTVEFNSACYYRYANVDMDQLTRNLQGDTHHARKALHAFIQAMVEAIPSGKQNTFAAHNPPSLVFAVVRERGQWNLVNAFAKPVVPTPQADLIVGSALRLAECWDDLTTMYGSSTIIGAWVVASKSIDDVSGVTKNGGQRVANIPGLIEHVLAAVSTNTVGGAA